MLMQCKARTALLVAVATCLLVPASVLAADVPAKTGPADAVAVATSPSTTRAKERRFARHQAFRRQAAYAPYRTCNYLGCPGHLILGIGF